jgi:acetyltransferase-like isoleucine patch superfamily enzyme
MTIWNGLRQGLVGLKYVLLLQRPRALGALGNLSRMEWPRQLQGRRHIHIGAATYIKSNGFIGAIAKYAGRQYTPEVRIGDHVYIGRNAYITCCNRVSIGNGAVLSEHVYITDLNHGFDPAAGLIMSQGLESKGPVAVGENCFLGYRVAVMPGVTLGDWCIVGANSVVTHSFPAYSMIAGVPARLIRVYRSEERRWVSASDLNLATLEESF